MPDSSTVNKSETPDVQSWQSSGTILVVDDEPMVRFVMTTVLSSSGLTVLEASDGSEGLELFREHDREIRAVLLDLSMPGMGGAEAFSEMRRWNPDVPIVLLSGFNERESVGRIPDEGLAGFIAKPFRPLTLLEKVREILEGA